MNRNSKPPTHVCIGGLLFLLTYLPGGRERKLNAVVSRPFDTNFVTAAPLNYGPVELIVNVCFRCRFHLRPRPLPILQSDMAGTGFVRLPKKWLSHERHSLTQSVQTVLGNGVNW